MAATESQMTALQSPMPSFDLADTATGGRIRSTDFAGHPVLAMFICNHCPFVVHVRGELARLGKDYKDSPLAIVAISSNDIATHPEDAPEHMAKEAKSAGYNFPYCFDGTQEVARLFHAACTPDFFLYDANHMLAYRGQLDGSRPKNNLPVDGKDLRRAIDAVLAGLAPSTDQRPSIGCNIKWKPTG